MSISANVTKPNYITRLLERTETYKSIFSHLSYTNKSIVENQRDSTSSCRLSLVCTTPRMHAIAVTSKPRSKHCRKDISQRDLTLIALTYFAHHFIPLQYPCQIQRPFKLSLSN